MVAPAMDLDMWKHPSTQRNISILQRDGVDIIYPGSGSLASGLEGKGRMAEPEEIFKEIDKYFSNFEKLKGTKVLVTAGPTYENIDPVRFIGNYSSGKMGFEIANEFANLGAEVMLVVGPVNIEIPDLKNIKRVDVTSAQEMYEASKSVFPSMDIAVFAAAVADYAPEKIAESKIKREKEDLIVIKLKRNPDIAATLGKEKNKNQITVGFALETDNELKNAEKKLKNKNLDLVVLNSLKNPNAGFMKDTNQITILTEKGEKLDFEAKSKKEVAKDIIHEILRYKAERR